LPNILIHKALVFDSHMILKGTSRYHDRDEWFIWRNNNDVYAAYALEAVRPCSTCIYTNTCKILGGCVRHIQHVLWT